MHSFTTSEDMYCRMTDAVAAGMDALGLVGALPSSLESGSNTANSGTMERKTRRMIPQHRVSRIRITWVQNIKRGSTMDDCMRQNFRNVGWSLATSSETVGSLGRSLLHGSVTSSWYRERLSLLARAGSRKSATIMTDVYVNCRRMLSDFISSVKASPPVLVPCCCSIFIHSEFTLASICWQQAARMGGKKCSRSWTGQLSTKCLTRLRRLIN